MSPRKAVLATTPPVPSRAEQLEQASPSSKLADLLEQFNGGTEYSCYVERLEQGGERTYMGKLALTDTLFDDVRAKWGGGRFTGRIIDAQTKYAGRLPVFRIDGPARIDDGSSSASSAPALVQGPTRFETVVTDALAGMGKAIEVLATKQAAMMDPTEQLVKLSGILATVNGTSTRGNGNGNASETVGLIRELMGLQREIADDRGPAPAPSVFGAALEGAVKPLVGVLHRKMDLDERKLEARQQRALSAPVPSSNGHTHGAPPVPDAAAVPIQSSDPLVNLIAEIPPIARHFLLSSASDEDDPADYVSMILNRLTDSAYDDMVRQLPRADFVNVLIEQFPAAGQYRPWFTELVEQLRASLELTDRGSSSVEGGPGEDTAAQLPPARGGVS